MEFGFKKRVSFHETDCMGVVHHSVYAKYFEEARVEWLYHFGVEHLHSPNRDYALAVLNLNVNFMTPLKLGDLFEIKMKGQFSGAKITFHYEIFVGDELKSTGSTLHIGVDSSFKVLKPPVELKEAIEKHLPILEKENG